MSNTRFDQNKEWFLGFDIGTNSVGWAVTDPQYNLLRFKGNSTWGIYLFDEAKTAQERRVNRTSRRRLERKKQRILLLQEMFAKSISEVDEKFYVRLKESSLWFDDRSTGDAHLLVGEKLNDKTYNKKYPTIHHLIIDLMENKEYHDPRLVYLACSYILAHRGHFLLEVSEENIDKVTDFNIVYSDLMSWFDSLDLSRPWECDPNEFGNILKKKSSISAKNKALLELLYAGKKPKDELSEKFGISIVNLLSLLCGKKVKLSDLFFNDTYVDIDVNSVSLGSATFDDEIELLSSVLEDSEYDILIKAKKVYDWSVLVDILNSEKYISAAKIKTYDQHKNDLRDLKYFIRKYSPSEYFNVFRKIGKDTNYPSYSYNVKNLGKNAVVPDDFKKSSSEEFCKYVMGKLKPLSALVEENDVEKYNSMIEKISIEDFCPKQMTSDNRVIPYQLYYIELKTILKNASKYLAFLNERDEYGSVADKILMLMTFRIPYYVGPLNNHSQYAWVVKKSQESIRPWNFDKVVDKDKSEDAFIRKMTATCTYLAGEDVLPKNSLLYSKYVVLNEINNIRVNGIKISVETKQKIYEELFLKKRRVSVKDIKNLFISNGIMTNEDELSGIDITVKSSLGSYHDFKEYIVDGRLKEADVESIINRITLTTDTQRLRVWLKQNYQLSDDECKKISKLKYSDFGRLSNRLLTQIYDLDSTTGEIRREENIIQMLWNTNENLMMLLSSKYGYSENIKKINEEYYEGNSKSLDEKLSEMYISNAVKRPILRTIEIAKELKRINGSDPKKVFIEMARGATEDQKNKRTKSRRDQITELYSNLDNKEEVKMLLSQLSKFSDNELRSEKIYLYFSQLGKCMYSGETINIEELGNNKLYDIDHIWPQSKIKDDSLDNKVLVKSEYNGDKGDTYPLKEEWREKNLYMWKSLRDKNLISEKKYERLKRNTPFTDEELADFINRQLVETRQSTKAVAEILKQLFKDSEIIYVKAGLTFDFRQTYKDEPYFALKCREVNDLHHAKDAYLNIVMGNIYNVLFTKDPLNFVKSGSKYTMRLKKMLERNIERNGEIAWITKDDEWFNRVIKTIHKNNIRFVRYSYLQKGAIFDIKPLRKGKGQVPRKNYLNDIDKYGGYNKQTVTGFYVVKYDDKKERSISFVAAPLMEIDNLNGIEDIKTFCEKCGYRNAEVLMNGRLVKPNTLLEIDGYRVHISGKSSGDIWFKGAQQLVLSPSDETYIKALVRFNERYLASKRTIEISSREGISSEFNAKLYDEFLFKIQKTKYQTFMQTAVDVLKNGKEKFMRLKVETQVECLLNILELFGCNNSHGKDLEIIGGKKNSGIQKMTMKFNKKRFSSIYIIDQSPTGLYEQYSPNLLSL